MDFSFDLNEMFCREIVRVGSDLHPPEGLRPGFRQPFLFAQRISQILDAMGMGSAEAQDLKAPITSGAKLRSQEEHTAYLLFDFHSNGGLGSVVGLLKVGRKNLFLLDKHGDQNEMYPLCILDFYVHESRQRSGCGRKLFEFMLQDQKIHPRFMAIDRPSPKLVSFLQKHYGLQAKIPQVNNYVIYDGFFSQPVEHSPNLKRTRIYMGKLQYC